MPFPFSECFVISCFHILTTTLNSDISRVAAYENATMSGVSVTPDTKLTLTYLVQRADVRLGSCETWAGNFVDDSRILPSSGSRILFKPLSSTYVLACTVADIGEWCTKINETTSTMTKDMKSCFVLLVVSTTGAFSKKQKCFDERFQLCSEY